MRKIHHEKLGVSQCSVLLRVMTSKTINRLFKSVDQVLNIAKLRSKMRIKKTFKLRSDTVIQIMKYRCREKIELMSKL